jgi:hypothetical protein
MWEAWQSRPHSFHFGSSCFELFDGLEEVAKFFDAGEGFVGGNFTSLECSTCLSDQLAKRIDNL